jgi:predicted SAM-dependent methyltransferase
MREDGTPLLLELGSGDRPFEDGRYWTHNDERELPHIEWVQDVLTIHEGLAFQGNVDELRATHLLEHFSHLKTVEILTNWRGMLSPGGTLYIEVPNFEAQCRALLSGRFPEAEVVTLAYGGQDYEGNFHKTGFTQETLTNSLFAAGFVSVSVQDADMVLCALAQNGVS